MTNSLKQKIDHLFQNHTIGTLATIEEGKPYSRFMLFYPEDLLLYTATSKKTHKVESLKQNPYVHVLLGLAGAGHDGAYCELEATVSTEDSLDKKEAVWNEKLNKWLDGPDDPNYLLLKLTPTKIRYFADSASPAEEYTI
ncbi:pyridoxamine 5'-phosphate oxidase family protein [Bacillus sp. B1-b2]|uniref:pyridoxamine 5'-phosphate oxidase family protein n=1 Tax=Bacillus sp. B1-b2 TaxID=2653201 RepID=UPI00126256FB|nr:pyridoxamine 5'-phosphate oxidase family protein [Bacillus sp. B1-b2]KAB7672533.1 general stress protein [Bacillus sp. B1-b2]